ncbi:MAG: type II toxin-antitoxin system RelE/ParE family toxin [Spirochaetes bacterium]|nr:type II toxin-antitoxin system RelE/ParE family toxin [Spirochaetota bacterium]
MWTIQRTSEIVAWVTGLDDDAKEAIYQSLLVLREIGPALGRPHVDTVKGSSFPNMKELRLQNKGRLFRIFFAFDPAREAILLIGGDKRGDKKFYHTMIPKADELYRRHLDKLRKKHESKKEKK